MIRSIFNKIYGRIFRLLQRKGGNTPPPPYLFSVINADHIEKKTIAKKDSSIKKLIHGN